MPVITNICNKPAHFSGVLLAKIDFNPVRLYREYFIHSIQKNLVDINQYLSLPTSGLAVDPNTWLKNNAFIKIAPRFTSAHTASRPSMLAFSFLEIIKPQVIKNFLSHKGSMGHAKLCISSVGLRTSYTGYIWMFIWKMFLRRLTQQYWFNIFSE